MFTGTFFGAVALLYYLCFLLLAGLSLFIGCRGSRRSRPGPVRAFLLLALSLLAWLLTLFLEVRAASPAAQLGLGRLNFAAVVFAAYFALRFVQEVPVRGLNHRASLWPWLLSETLLLGALTLFTPLVDAAEAVQAGRAVTTYGPLFPGYLLHVLGYLTAALLAAFRKRRQAKERAVRRQLALIGAGMCATGGMAVVTNALLPYGFGDFRFCDAGTLSTLFFVLATAYATLIHRLFDVRVLIRETLVYGVLLAFVLGGYSSAVFVLTQYLTSGAEKLTQFAVLLLAFSFDPLRRFLEEKTDALLFDRRGEEGGRGTSRGNKKGRRTGSRLTLALLFPWHRR